MLVTNQAGLADSLLGVLGVMIASGLGLLACVTARRRPMRFGLTVAAVLLAALCQVGVSGRLIYVERSFFGVVRVTHDPELNVHRLFPRHHAARAAKPRSGTCPRAFDLLHAFRADRPGFRVARAGLEPGRVAELRSSDLEQARWRVTLGPARNGRFTKSIRLSRGSPGSAVLYVSARLPGGSIEYRPGRCAAAAA